jgi:peptidoglycan/LPS O-acetylase OafA/YrhL
VWFGKRIRVGLTLAILAVLAWRSFLYLIVNAGTAYVYNAFDCRFDSLAVGCLIAAWSTSPKFLALATTLAHPVLPVLTIAALGVSRMLLPVTYHYTVGFTVDALLLGVLILQLLQVTSTPWWSWLDSAPLRYLGRISYPIYLWHILAVGFASRFVNGVPARILVGGLLAVLVASASYYLIEKPALRFRTKSLRAAVVRV